MRKGRDFEKLVASFEEFAKLKNIQLLSPEYITGKNSNQKREVDITLRCMIGTSPILVAIECRDREKTQGVEWIEQLITKKEDIDADTLVVVSSSKFSQGVINIAKNKGIQLRYIKTFDPNETEKWFSKIIVEVVTLNILFNSVNMQLIDFNPDTDKLVEQNIHQLSFFNRVDDKEINFMSLMNKPAFKDQMEKKKPNIVIKSHIKFPEELPPFYLKTAQKNIYIGQIDFEYIVKPNIVTVPLSDISEYSDATANLNLMKSANFRTKINNKEYTIRILKDQTSGGKKILVDTEADIKKINVETKKGKYLSNEKKLEFD